MKRSGAVRILALALLSLFALGPSHAAEIVVLADGPLQPPLIQIGAEFKQRTGHTAIFHFSPSPVIKKRIADGESFDLLLVQPEFIDQLRRVGKVESRGSAIFARVGIGLAARAESPDIDVRTPESFKQALLSAERIVVNNVASGNYFSSLLSRLGLQEKLAAKLERVSPSEVFPRLLAANEKGIAVGTVPQIKATHGVKLLGAIPTEYQEYLQYAVATSTTTREAEAATSFSEFLYSSEAKQALTKSGAYDPE